MTGAIQAMNSGASGGGGGGGSSLALSLSSTVASGAAASSSVTSNVITGTASGGTAPYPTYLWTITSADGITALNPNSASTAFHVSGLAPSDVASGSASLRVTDSVGAFKDSANVSITLTNTNSS